MALVLADRVQENSTSTGTGPFTLSGAVLGYQTFAVIGNGNSTYYTIAEQGGSEWEVGIGTYTASTTSISRDTVLASSNAGALVNFGAGNKTVFVTYPSEKSVNYDSSGVIDLTGNVNVGSQTIYGGTGNNSILDLTGDARLSGLSSRVLIETGSGGSADNTWFFNQDGTTDFPGTTTAINAILAYATTTASGTTVNLTADSSYHQRTVGSTTQTYKLPVATGLSYGLSFAFDNDASGLVTIINDASATVATVQPGGYEIITLVDTSTSAGSWVNYGLTPSGVDWGTNTLNLGSTVISGGTWQGGTIQPGYGGTGLTTFTGANNALYSTSSSALTAGTLPVPAGGTGQTSFPSGHIPYGNTTAALQSSSSLEFNGTYLIVGGTTPLGGATNPITAFSSTANNYVQTYVYNASTGTSASADLVAYADNSTDSHGWADMGYTSSTYADAIYTITGPNEAYLFGSAPSGAGATGNLVYATDNTGSANAHQWYVGGFTQAKSAYKMQLDANKLELKTSLYVDGSSGTSGQVLTSAGSGAAPTWTTPITGGGTVTTTDFTATAGQTVFTVSYTVGATEVYQNGVKLGIADFTATNGTSITLATGATAGDIVEVVTFSTLNLYSTITYEDFSGNGSQTVFTMSAVPANSASLLVTISGVVQDPGTYTVSSNTLTFLTAPPSGSSNISVRYLGVASVGTVGSFSGGTTGLTPASATTGAVVLGGTLIAANGGTGLTSSGASGNVLTSNGTGWTSSAIPSQFASGTSMLFQQTAAPTGWTKSLTHDNKALRVVSGTASSGGTVAFTTAFASQAVNGTVGTSGATTLTSSQIPAHTHGYSGSTGTVSADHSHRMFEVSTSAALTPGPNGFFVYSIASGSQFSATQSANHTHAFSGTTDNGTGGGTSHTHSGGTFTGTAINLAVQYVDLIIATKD